MDEAVKDVVEGSERAVDLDEQAQGLAAASTGQVARRRPRLDERERHLRCNLQQSVLERRKGRGC